MIRRTLTVAAVTTAFILMSTTASAQTLGVLELDEHEGAVGDAVTGQVDPVVVEDSCATTPAEVAPLFFDTDGPTPNPWSSPGPVFLEWLNRGDLVGITPPPDGDWPGVEQFFPGSGFWVDGEGPPPANVEDQFWAWRIWGANAVTWGDETGWEWNREIQAATIIWLFMEGLGGAGAGDIVLEAYLPQTFVFAFADIETQQPIGDLSNFDPHTGRSVEDPPLLVPDVEPGVWPVIATCIDLHITDESFLAAVEAAADWLEDNEINPDLRVPFSATANQHVIEGVAAAALPHLAVPGGGPWVDLYCILDADGVCHPELRGIALEDLTEEQLEQFEDLTGEDLLMSPDPDGEPELVIAETTPRFTG